MKFFFALLLVGCSGAPFTLAEQQAALELPEASAETSAPDASSSEAAPADAPSPPLSDADAGATSAVEATADCVIPPTFGITPLAVHFGKVLIGSTTAPIYVSLINRGSCTANSDLVGFGIPPPFTDPSTCANARLAPNGSCVFEVSFTPPGVGDFHEIAQGTVWGQSLMFSVDGTGAWSL